MKANQGSSQSCSCTSCIYKSESEQPSVQRFIADGSRIDKLYLGKYIPLREKKLLAKLLMTRAVYDDVRTEILSSSGISTDQKADLRSRKHGVKNEEGIVDKGAALQPRKLSECCSCCSSVCGLQYKAKATRPQRHSHYFGANLNQYKTSARYGGNKVTSKSSVMTRNNRHKNRSKAKGVHSTPCVCPWNKNRQTGLEHAADLEDEQMHRMRRRHKVPIRRHSKSRIRRSFEEGARSSIKVLKQSKSRMKRNLQGTARKSIDKIKNTKTKMKNKVAGMKNVHKSPPHIEGINYESKEDWACDIGCEPEQCEPEECLKKLLQKKSRRLKRASRHKRLGAQTHITASPRTKLQPQLGERVTANEPKININFGKGEKGGISKGKRKSKDAIESKDTASNTNTAAKKANVGFVTKEKGETPRRKVKSTDVTCACETKSVESITKVLGNEKTQNMSQQSKINHAHKKSEAKLRQLMKDTQAGHTLKRCFCTLKLKTMNLAQKKSKSATSSKHRKGLKRYSTESMQTEPCVNKCHPIQCMPSECKNTDCAKRVKSFRAKEVITAHQIKSISSATKSSSSTTSKQSQAYPSKKIKSSQRTSVKPFIQIPKHQKQITETRNESTSSFKDWNEKQFNKNRVLRGDEYPHQHKRSQGIISTGRSKYTLTKNNLRRCFCTLKLTKPPKQKSYFKTLSKASTTSLNATKADKQQSHLMNKSPTHHKMHSNKNRNIKSSSSFTSRSETHAKAKRVHSTELPHKTEVLNPTRKNKEVVVITKKPREAKLTTKRQPVKIGSNVSFNVEFYKDRSEPSSDTPIKYIPRPQEALKNSSDQDVKKKFIKERGSQGDYTRQQKSVPMRVTKNKKDARIGAAIKRCFCTLKLQKSSKNMTKSNIYDEKSFTRIANKGTTPKLHVEPLEPYECEPRVCIPEKCDSLECLERIKNRNSKEYGTSTENFKMKSSSSTTQSPVISSGTGSNRTRMKKQATTTKFRKPTHVKKTTSKELRYKQSRQIVRIGSSFSFDIEFYKNRVPVVQKRQAVDITAHTISKPQKHVESKGSSFHISNSSQESQVRSRTKMHRGLAVKPMLKRCFCTLQLLNQDKKENAPKKNKMKPSKVYTVSRVTIAPTKLITDGKLSAKGYNIGEHHIKLDSSINKKNTNRVGVNSNHHNIFQKSSSSFNSCITAQDALLLNDFRWQKDSSVRLISLSALSNQQIQMNTAIHLQRVNDYNNLLKHSIHRNFITENLWSLKYPNLNQYHKELQRFEHNECNEDQETNSYQPRYNCLNPIMRNNFYASNIEAQLNPLPYECEPGICVPYPSDCDYNECLKLINKRLIRSKKAGSGLRSSTSSFANSSPDSKARKLQSYVPHHTQKTKAGTDSNGAIQCKVVPRLPEKRMLRVRSSFSIELSKNKRQITKKLIKHEPQINHKYIKPKTMKYKTKWTNKTTSYQHNQESQSGVIIVQNESSGSTQLKSCVCALKLLKKDKITLGTMVTSNKRKEVNMADVCRSTKSYKPSHALDPYECAHVCIPDQCNPHECLKLKKKRSKKYNYQGTHSLSSSSTSNRARTRKNYKESRAQTILRKINPHENVAVFKGIPSKISSSPTQNRQVVRIESSFSFNIELYKHRLLNRDNMQPVATYLTKKPSKRTFKQQKIHSASTKSTSGGRYLRYQDSQVHKVRTQDSTSASDTLKRCFCTMKFHKPVPEKVKTLSPKTLLIKKLPTMYVREDLPHDKNNLLPTHSGEEKNFFLSRRALRIESKFSIDLCKDQGGNSLTVQCDNFGFNSKAKTRKSLKPKQKQIKKVAETQRIQRLNKALSIESNMTMLTKNMVSDIGGVKRCFCTLRLQAPNNKLPTSNNQNKKNIQHEGKDLKVILEPKQNTAHHKKRKHSYKLEPYECEPGVCIPGECDPYECEKRIKRRGMHSQLAGTDKYKGRSISSLASGEGRDKAGQTQSQSPKYRDKRIDKTESYVVEQPRFNASGSPHRQAVRISSSFSFNIEFYKDKTAGISDVPAKSKYETKRNVCNKDGPCDKTVCARGVCQDKAICSQGICLRNRGLQAHGPKTENTGSGVGPMLKRCFCTLKLQKNLTQEQKAMLESMNPRQQKAKEIATTDIGIGTKKKYNKLEPYECEPGVCVPGQCDPYECLKRIQKRNMKNFGTVTAPTNKSNSTLTHKDLNNRDKNTQSHRVKEKRHKVATAIQPEPVKQLIKENRNNRQSVRIGSNFGFDIEFFKDRIAPREIIRESPTTHQTKYINDVNVNTKEKRTANKGHGYDKHHRDQSQMAGVNTESAGSGMGPLLKRCFCTLKLKKATHAETKIVNFMSLDVKAPHINVKNTPKTLLGTNKPLMTEQNISICKKQIQTSHNNVHCRGNVKNNHKRYIDNVKESNNTEGLRPCQRREKNIKFSSLANVFKRYLCTLKSKKNERCDQKYFPQSKSEIKNKNISDMNEKNTYLNTKHNNILKVQKFQMAQKTVKKNNISSCVNLYNKNSYSGMTERVDHEMTTIFPYVPHKFKNNVSNTFFTEIKSYPKTAPVLITGNTPQSKKKSNNYTKNNTKALNNIKQLPNKSINAKSTNKINIKEMFHRFTNRITKSFQSKKQSTENHITIPPKPCNLKSKQRQKHKGLIETDILKISKSDRYSINTKNVSIAKKSKSVKVTRVSAKEKHSKNSPRCTTQRNTRYSHFQSGDTDKRSPAMRDLKSFSKPYKCDVLQCSYCETHYNIDKKTIAKARSSRHPFHDSKIIQLALLSQKKGTAVEKFQTPDFCPCVEGEIFDKKKLKKSGKFKDVKQTKDDKSKVDKKIKDGKDKAVDKAKVGKAKADGKTKDAKAVDKAKVGKAKADGKTKDGKGKVDKKTQATKTKKDSKKGKIDKKSKTKASLKKKEQTKKGKKGEVKCKTNKPCVCCKGTKPPPPRPEPLDDKKKGKKKKKAKPIKPGKCIVECKTESVDTKSITEHLCELYKKYLEKQKKDPCEYKPLFEMKLASKNMTLINSDAVFEEIKHMKSDKKKYMQYMSPKLLEQSHGKDCKCCLCVAARQGKVQGGAIECIKYVKDRLSGVKPCICGSDPCAQMSQELREVASRRKQREKSKKTCVCGTKICEDERLKIDLQDRFIDKKKAASMKKDMVNQRSLKQKAKQQKVDQKNLIARQKKYKAEDAIRLKQRLKAEKLADKQVQRFRNSSDTVLVAESFIDIIKLVFKSIGSFLHCMGRAVFDPKNTCHTLKTAKEDPKRILTTAQGAWSNSGVSSTAKRVGQRLASTRIVGSIKGALEEHAASRYLIHSCDKDPKKRMAKRRVRRREPVDFQCSLFMASLRKRPWLCVYYKCPWFYPHCISMLNIWRHFTDVVLFLLAVFVWSPCILAMEICRACMCCTMCTA